MNLLKAKINFFCKFEQLLCMIPDQKPRLYKLMAARLLFLTCNDTNLALNVSTIALAV